MGKKDVHQIVNEEKTVRAMLVGLQLRQSDEAFARAMDELGELAKACGIEPVSISTQKVAHPVQATYIGSGKVDEIKNAAEMLQVDLVVFDQTLTPMQFRNLGKLLGTEVMDRTGLILRIFAEQARTREARLQVEHARLQYIMPRLAGMWTHSAGRPDLAEVVQTEGSEKHSSSWIADILKSVWRSWKRNCRPYPERELHSG